MPKFYESNSVVSGNDFDHDGDIDLFVGGRNVPFQYPKAANSRLLRNDSKAGQIAFSDITNTAAKELLNYGLVCNATWADLDGDKWDELILASEFAPIQIFKNVKGKLSIQKETGVQDLKGLWTSIQAADLDKDGDLDLVAGNMGENTLLKANADRPVEIVHGDLDGNDVYDLFPFVYFVNDKGEYDSYPLHGKDDINKMMVGTKKRWVYFKEYGKVNQAKFFTEEEKKKAQTVGFNSNSSVWIENKGAGKFVAHELPVEAQFSCINSIEVMDVNKDGNPDILFVGNNYANEVFVGRYDASNGGVLLGNGKGGFKFYRDSGFEVTGDAKSLIRLKDKFIAGQNRGPIKVFKWLN